MRQGELEKEKDYKYGFTTDIESIRAPKGLNEDVIKFISKIKREPKWTPQRMTARARRTVGSFDA